MLTTIFKNGFSLILLLAIFIVGAHSLAAQTGGMKPLAAGSFEFTYQGRLTDNNLPANTSYDFEFRLYDQDTGGTQLAGTNERLGVPVASGVFTVHLNFLSNFNGAERYLEIAVKPVGGGSYTTLTPRQRFTAAPYAIHSVTAELADEASNATFLNGLDSSQYVLTGDSRLSGPRPPTSGSNNYIQNGLAPQVLSNFNISGDGTAGGTLNGNSINSATQYNIGGDRVLSTGGGQNLFAGLGAGEANTGTNNVFLGNGSGASNTTGGDNSFVGTGSGANNTTGTGNAFLGTIAGLANTTGNNNTFAGTYAGMGNSTGLGNSFVGYEAGKNATTGQANVVVGVQAGLGLTTQSNNTLIGAGSNVLPGVVNSTALGVGAQATVSDSVVLGIFSSTVRVPGNLNVTGTLNSNGSGLTNLSASNITSGTLNNARLGTVPTANGGTGLSATGAAGNFLRSDGSVWTSAPLSGSDIPGLGGTYIQNGTAQQATSNFNISGNGTAGGTLNGNIVNATTQFNIGANRVFSIDGNQGTFVGNSAGLANSGVVNTFVGHFAGASNTTGGSNSFLGSLAGFANTTGANNSIFGAHAGMDNTTGIGNSFFGTGAGSSNTSGSTNAFFGASTGQFNVGGGNNSFFGGGAGTNNVSGNFNTFLGSFTGTGNTTGIGNSYVGYEAGKNTTTGQGNTIVGTQSGANLTTENFNTIIGSGADVSAGATNATAIGVGALATSSNSVVLGTASNTVRVPGNLNVTGTFNANGSALTNLNAGNITTGTLNNARLGTVPTANGGTGLSATGAAGNFLRSDGSVWTSAPLSGSDIPNLAGSYIQNGTSPQATSNFNISGDGTVGGTLRGDIVRATTQFNIGTSRVLFTDGSFNTFVGLATGGINTGSSNSFFGRNAGFSNTAGAHNAFFGRDAGKFNASGDNNAFIGEQAGFATTGDNNTFVGRSSGFTNTSGNSNTTLGNQSDVGSATLTNATAIGANASVTANNSLVLGSINGVNGATADTKVGIGTTAPAEKLSVETATSKYGLIHTDGTITVGTFVGGAGVGGYFGTKSNHPLHFFANDSAARMTLDTNGEVGIGTVAPKAKLDVTGGDILVGSNGQGMILKSPDGTKCLKLTVDNAGALATAIVACPL